MLDPLLRTDPIWTHPDACIDEAINLMEERGFHHLPVLSDGKLVGMVSDRDVLTAVGWKLLCERRRKDQRTPVGPRQVRDIMTSPVYTIHRGGSVSHAAHIMTDHGIGALPVIEDGRLIGLITSTDLLKLSRTKHGPMVNWARVFKRPVSALMTTGIITIRLDTGLNEIGELLTKYRFRHYPVIVGDDLLIGMISDRDYRRALGESVIHDTQAEDHGTFYLGPTTANDIMQRHIKTIGQDELSGAASNLMLQNKIHALPVLDRDRLVGILTARDIIAALAFTADSSESQS